MAVSRRAVQPDGEVVTALICGDCGSTRIQNRKHIELANGSVWYIWDDGCRFWAMPAPGNPVKNWTEPAVIFEYKHFDQPAGLIEHIFASIKESVA